MRSTTARHVLATLGLVLAGCTNGPTLSDAPSPADMSACSQLNDVPSDRHRADPAQLKLISEGKEHYRRGQYGLAENKFRKATEETSFGAASRSRVATLEAWYGLAASYDQLRRFDLADPIYAHIKSNYGASATYYNNYGYSLELRGDKAEARKAFEKATRLAPGCQVSRNNLDSLDGN